MKILILSDTFPKSPDSFEEIDLNLARSFSERGNDVFVLTATLHAEEEGWDDAFGPVKVFRLYVGGWWMGWGKARPYLSLRNPFISGRIRKIISEVHPDVVHAHKVNRLLSYHSLLVARQLGFPVFLTAHDVMGFSAHISALSERQQERGSAKITNLNLGARFRSLPRKLKPIRYQDLLRLYLRNVDGIIAVSHALMKVLSENGIDTVKVIYNGVLRSLWNPTSDEVREMQARLHLEGKRVIVFVGLVSPLKGLRQVMDAMTRVTKEVSNTILVIAGDDKGTGYAGELRRFSEEKGIGIILLGRICAKELRALYGVADVTVTFSITNPYSMVAHEARACGSPVLWGTFGDATEIAERYKAAGFIENPWDASLLADSIVGVLRDTAKRQELLAQGKMMSEDFDSKTQAEEYLAMFVSAVTRNTSTVSVTR